MESKVGIFTFVASLFEEKSPHVKEHLCFVQTLININIFKPNKRMKNNPFTGKEAPAASLTSSCSCRFQKSGSYHVEHVGGWWTDRWSSCIMLSHTLLDQTLLVDVRQLEQTHTRVQPDDPGPQKEKQLHRSPHSATLLQSASSALTGAGKHSMKRNRMCVCPPVSSHSCLK